MTPLESFNVVLVGAGEINFGSSEGPWNHSLRLETLLGDRLNVLAVIDPDVGRGQTRIADKVQSPKTSKAWLNAQGYATVTAAGAALKGVHISLIVNGCPPHYRGTTQDGKDVDVQLLAAFQDIGAVLVEKPVAAADPKAVDCGTVARMYRDSDAIVAVGYMLRYLKTVQKMKLIMRENNIVPLMVNARYLMAYEFANKLAWWNKEISCGPVVEQATHFVDLIRYLAGSEVIAQSVTATTVEHNEEAGRLSKLSFDESAIEPQNRVPRLTVATWKHRRGTVASLCHGIALHGNKYDTEIDVVADGWRLRLVDAYSSAPSLYVTKPGQTAPEVVSVDDDPFASQFETLIGAVERPSSGGTAILSTYEDALQTYELSWLIRRAGERMASGTAMH